ncbi:hypothetical protein M9458_057540, partial [Cirrhinus mrigala]
GKDADVETVPLAQNESGFTATTSSSPKKDGGLRPILDLRRLNRALMRRLFRILTLQQILSQCMDAALFPLKQKGICILNYLNDWLILVQSEDKLLPHRSFLLSHLDCLGLRVNFAKSALSPSQWISFLGTVLDLTLMRAVVVPERALAIQQLTASFKIGASHPLKAVQKMLGLMASSSPVPQLGLLLMRPLAETESSIPCLTSRMPSCQCRPGLCSSASSLEGPSVLKLPNLLLYSFPPSP